MSPAVFYVVFLLLPVLVLWAIVLSDIVIRKDLRVTKKLGWAAVTLVLAEIGALIYVVMRPVRFPEEREDPVAEGTSATRNFLQSAADHVDGQLGEEAWAEEKQAWLG